MYIYKKISIRVLLRMFVFITSVTKSSHATPSVTLRVPPPSLREALSESEISSVGILDIRDILLCDFLDLGVCDLFQLRIDHGKALFLRFR